MGFRVDRSTSSVNCHIVLNLWFVHSLCHGYTLAVMDCFYLNARLECGGNLANLDCIGFLKVEPARISTLLYPWFNLYRHFLCSI